MPQSCCVTRNYGSPNLFCFLALSVAHVLTFVRLVYKSVIQIFSWLTPETWWICSARLFGLQVDSEEHYSL